MSYVSQGILTLCIQYTVRTMLSAAERTGQDKMIEQTKGFAKAGPAHGVWRKMDVRAPAPTSSSHS